MILLSHNTEYVIGVRKQFINKSNMCRCPNRGVKYWLKEYHVNADIQYVALLLNLHRLLFLHFFSCHVWITKILEVKQPTDRIRKINISHTTQKCILGQQSLKERVKWCIANESNTGSEYERPWLQYTRLCIILLSQCFPVLVRMAYFYSKGFTHLLTLVFFFLPWGKHVTRVSL